MKNKFALTLLLLPLIAGCSFPSVAPSNPTPTDPVEEETPDPAEEKTEDNIYSNAKYSQEFLDFFNPDSKVEIELNFTNESIYNLKEYGQGEGNNNYIKNEMYHPCTAKITVNGKTTTFEETGARIKGNLSRRDTDFVNPDGMFNTNKLCHFKLNFGQTFSDSDFYYVHDWTDNLEAKKERNDREFAGMKKIDLKWNRNYDYTFTKEAYVLDAFKEEGVIAQHANLVKFTIRSESDSFSTTYLAYESVDKKMLKKINGDNKGDLYKCTYTDLGPATLTDLSDNKVGVEGQYYRPIYNLKSNEDTSDFSIIKNFSSELNKNSKADGLDGQAYFENISKYLDVDNFLRYSALCWVFGLPDDLRNNYNNYYLYFNKDNKAIFIPYDNDRCLGINVGWQKDMKNMRYDDPNCWGENNFNQCPLVLRLLTGGSNNTHKVHSDSKLKFFNYCKEFANKYLDVTKFDEYTKRFEYAPYKNIAVSNNENETFEIYAKAKLATLSK